MMRRFSASTSGLTQQQRRQQRAGITSHREGESLQEEGTVSRTFQQVKETASDLASRSTNNLSALSSQAKDGAIQSALASARYLGQSLAVVLFYCSRAAVWLVLLYELEKNTFGKPARC